MDARPWVPPVGGTMALVSEWAADESAQVPSLLRKRSVSEIHGCVERLMIPRPLDMEMLRRLAQPRPAAPRPKVLDRELNLGIAARSAHLKPLEPERLDAKLWPGAAKAGWRGIEAYAGGSTASKVGNWQYVSPQGIRFRSVKAVREWVEGGMPADPKALTRRPGEPVPELEPERLDAKLWPGAAAAGWRALEAFAGGATSTKEGSWKYVSPGGVTYRSVKAVREWVEGGELGGTGDAPAARPRPSLKPEKKDGRKGGTGSRTRLQTYTFALRPDYKAPSSGSRARMQLSQPHKSPCGGSRDLQLSQRSIQQLAPRKPPGDGEMSTEVSVGEAYQAYVPPRPNPSASVERDDVLVWSCAAAAAAHGGDEAELDALVVEATARLGGGASRSAPGAAFAHALCPAELAHRLLHAAGHDPARALAAVDEKAASLTPECESAPARHAAALRPSRGCALTFGRGELPRLPA